MKVETLKNKVWIKQYPEAMETIEEYNEWTLYDILRRSVRKYPDKTAIIYNESQLSYAELMREVQCLAGYLYSIGARKDTKIGIILPNCPNFVISCYSAMALGAQFIMINHMFTDNEFKCVLEKSGIKYVFCVDYLVDRLTGLGVKGIEKFISCSLDDYPRMPGECSVNNCGDILNYRDCMNATTDGFPEPDYTWEHIACFQCTGGTSGKLKAAILTHKNLSIVLQNYDSFFYDAQKGEDTFLSVLPLYHIYGMQLGMNLAIYLGDRNVILPKPRVNDIMDAIITWRINYCPLVPTLMIRMLEHEDISKITPDYMKCILTGGSSLPTDVLQAFQTATNSYVCEGFGLTEAAPATHMNPYGGRINQKAGSIGIPMINTDAIIADPDDYSREMPCGEQGELLIRGHQLSQGYLMLEDGDGEFVDSLVDGWLPTGDIAYMDEDGFFYIIGRRKEVIVSGAYNVYPYEIEQVIRMIPEVSTVQVIGIPHDTLGETAAAFVCLKEGAQLNVERMKAVCEENLAKFKLPTKYYIVDSLPYNAAGKPLKYILKNNYSSGMYDAK